jgi:hypothetical protein
MNIKNLQLMLIALVKKCTKKIIENVFGHNIF